MAMGRKVVTTGKHPPAGGGEISLCSRVAPRRLLQPTLSKKFVAFVGILLLATLANALVVRSMLEQRRGIAEMINVAGSLRWLSQRTQVEVQRAVLGNSGVAAALGAHLDSFERRMRALELGGDVDGVQVKRLPEGLQPAVAHVRHAWQDYRSDIAGMFDKWKAKQDVTPELNQIYLAGTAILTAADGMVGQLAREAGAAEERAVITLYVLVLVDVGVLVVGLLLIQGRVVAPLRRLAEASRQFAQGNYAERVGFRSRDEIGQLAEAFDHMADETESHIRRIDNDVAELGRAHQGLRLLSQALECSPVSAIITDSYGTIEYVNPKFCEITGYTREEAVGQKPRLLRSGMTLSEVYESLWKTVLSGREWRGELRNRKKSGELFWESTRISPLWNEEGRVSHFIAVQEDITERKRAEEEVRRLNVELEQRVRERTRRLQASNDELEAFSYSVSHDLRAPLRAINGFSQLLGDCCADCRNREAMDYLARIRKGSVRMAELIDDLLRLAHLGRAELAPERVDLSAVAREVMADLASTAPGRGVELEIPDPVQAWGDPRLLRIVLENLLGNAWKFTAKRSDAHITLGAREENGERVIFVRDNGAGFDPRYAAKLFGAFQRLHRADEFDGSGIGLAIVQRIVHLHGGRIWAESAPGQGATFSFVLPEPGDTAPQPVNA